MGGPSFLRERVGPVVFSLLALGLVGCGGRPDAANYDAPPSAPRVIASVPDWVHWVRMSADMGHAPQDVQEQIKKFVEMASQEFTEEDWRTVRRRFSHDLIVLTCRDATGLSETKIADLEAICARAENLIARIDQSGGENSADAGLCDLAGVREREFYQRTAVQAQLGRGHEDPFLGAVIGYHTMRAIEGGLCGSTPRPEDSFAYASSAFHLWYTRPKTVTLGGELLQNKIEEGRYQAYAEEESRLAAAMSERGIALARTAGR